MRGINKFIFYTTLLSTFLISSNFFSQDIHFSQYNQVLSFVNPALVGVNGDFRATLNYKDQWKPINAAFKTFAFTGEYAFVGKRSNKNTYLAMGINAFNDVAGEIQYTNQLLSMSLAGFLNADHLNTFSAGIQVGYAQQSYNIANMKWGSQFNGTAFEGSLPGETIPLNNQGELDVTGGLAWNFGIKDRSSQTKNKPEITFGVSYQHSNPPKESFYKTAADKRYDKQNIYGNCELSIKKTSVKILPSFLIQRQGPSNEIVVSCYIKYILADESKYTNHTIRKAISFGLISRIGDSVTPAMLLEINKFDIGMSYDVNVSKLITATSAKGGFEILLRYRTKSFSKDRSIRI